MFGLRSRAGSRLLVACVFVAFLLAGGAARAQRLTFVAGYREIGPPDYASYRLGPFYSNLRFVQTVGLRYSASTTNILNMTTGERKGVFKKDGFEIPMVSTLALRNYLPISKNADLDASASCSYAHYPIRTQEDQFGVNLVDQSIAANFNVNYQSRITPYLNVKAYDQPAYSTDYVDLTGRIDEYGGSAYERFQNTLGVQADYLVKRNMNLSAVATRSDVWPQVNAFSNQQSTTYNSSLAYEWEVNPRLDTGLQGMFTSGSYPNSKQGGYLSQNYTAFARADVTRNIKASTTLGYSLSGVSEKPGKGGSDSGTLIGSLGVAMALSKRISQKVSLSRSQRRGFESGLETSDSLKYDLGWKGEFIALTLTAGADDTSVEFGDTSGYSGKFGGISVAVPVSQAVTVRISTDYAVRGGGSAVSTNAAAELTSDYETWVSRIATGWDISKDISITVYGQYANRGSANSAMRYEQYMFGADCGYSYEF